MTTVTITVPGKAWANGLDPGATGVPAEHGWPDYSRVRSFGRYGQQFIYKDIAVEVAIDMAEHLADLGEMFVMGADDPGTAADGRACIAAAKSIQDQVREQRPE